MLLSIQIVWTDVQARPMGARAVGPFELMTRWPRDNLEAVTSQGTRARPVCERSFQTTHR